MNEKTFLPLLIPVVLIMRQPDLGTAIILMLIFFTIALLIRLRWESVVAVVLILVMIAGTPSPLDRLRTVSAEQLADRDGKERVAKGAVLSDADLWKMDWFVKGVVTQK